VQVLFLIWIITGLIAANDDDPSCEGLMGDALELCRDAGDAIGVGLITGCGRPWTSSLVHLRHLPAQPEAATVSPRFLLATRSPSIT
jgi:hypothetical protein